MARPPAACKHPRFTVDWGWILTDGLFVVPFLPLSLSPSPPSSVAIFLYLPVHVCRPCLVVCVCNEALRDFEGGGSTVFALWSYHASRRPSYRCVNIVVSIKPVCVCVCVCVHLDWFVCVCECASASLAALMSLCVFIYLFFTRVTNNVGISFFLSLYALMPLWSVAHKYIHHFGYA